MARNNPAYLTPARRTIRGDDAAQGNLTNTLLGLVIGYVVILFVSILLFNSIGPDTQAICDDPTNFTQQECDDATTAREMFWTILIMAGVAVILAIVGIVTMSVRSTTNGGGGRRRRR